MKRIEDMFGQNHWLFSSNLVRIGIAFFLVLIVFAYIPPSYNTLNCFDVPKRLLWSVLALFLSLSLFFERRSGAESLHVFLIACLLWIVGRSLVRENPTIELEVLASWVLPGLFFGLGLAVSPKSIRPIAWALLFVGIAEGTLMILQYIGRDPLFPETTSAFTRLPHRMIGTIGNQNQAVDILSLSCAALYILVRKPFLRLCLLSVMLVVVSLTACRGAMVGLMGAVLIAEVFSLWNRCDRPREIFSRIAILIIVIFSVTAGAVMLMPVTRERVAELIHSPDDSRTVSFRGTMAKIATTMWAEKPITGWGAGAFAFQYLDRLEHEMPEVMSYENLSRIKFVREAHNETLQFAAEFGWVGILLVGGVLFCMLRLLWSHREAESVAVASCMFILGYVSLKSLVSFPMQAPVAGALSALLLGLMVPRCEREVVVAPRRSFWAFGGVYLAIAIGLLVWNSVDAYYNISVPRRIKQGQAVKLSEELPQFLYKYQAVVGSELARSGDIPEAMISLERAHTGYRNPMMYNNLAYVYSRLGRWNEVVAVCEKWVGTGIEYWTALKNLSGAYEYAGNLYQAAKTGEKYLRFVSCDEEAPVKRVLQLYLRENCVADAVRVIQWYEARPIVSAESLSSEYDKLTASVFQRAGDRAEAEERFRSALQKKP